MASHFYAFASAASARQSRPDWFEAEGDGVVRLKPERVLRSTRGVWLVEPSAQADETSESDVIGERSLPFVIISAQADGPPSKKITPPGEGGFA